VSGVEYRTRQPNGRYEWRTPQVQRDWYRQKLYELSAIQQQQRHLAQLNASQQPPYPNTRQSPVAPQQRAATRQGHVQQQPLRPLFEHQLPPSTYPNVDPTLSAAQRPAPVQPSPIPPQSHLDPQHPRWRHVDPAYADDMIQLMRNSNPSGLLQPASHVPPSARQVPPAVPPQPQPPLGPILGDPAFQTPAQREMTMWLKQYAALNTPVRRPEITPQSSNVGKLVQFWERRAQS
jgi:hypothetical protein